MNKKLCVPLFLIALGASACTQKSGEGGAPTQPTTPMNEPTSPGTRSAGNVGDPSGSPAQVVPPSTSTQTNTSAQH